MSDDAGGVRQRGTAGPAEPNANEAAKSGPGGGGGKGGKGRGKGRGKIKFSKSPAWLDHALTGAFLGQCVFVPWMAWRLKGGAGAGMYVALLVAVGAVIEASKWLARAFGGWLSDRLPTKPLATPVQMKKFSEQFWQLVVHAGMAALEWHVVSREDWWDNAESVWMPSDKEEAASPGLRAELSAKHEFGRPCWHSAEPKYISSLALLIYWTQLAIWVYTCYVHRWRDEPRKDYFVMYLHHVMTIALVAGSAFTGNFRVGILVLLVHDFSDIFVDLLKICNYLNLEGPRGLFLSEISYLVNLVMWSYWRLYEFPTRVIHTAFVSSAAACLPVYEFPAIFPAGLEFWPLANAMLGALLVLHVWWYFLMLRIGYKLVMGINAHQAGREEYEGDSD